MNSSYRDALLEGVRVAAELHLDLDSRTRLDACPGSSIDVIDAIIQLDVPLLFRPMDKLLGACVSVDDAVQGIMVTTERDLHMQRFTAAHELGHVRLGHQGSVDLEDDIGFLGRTTEKDLAEVAADSFAAAFLAPKWLVRHHCIRQRWTQSDVQTPDVVYQLSLRLGISYLATCWALQSHRIIDYPVASYLRSVEPKKSKQRLLRGLALGDPWADVWSVRVLDQGGVLVGGPSDMVVLELIEHAASGYEWDSSLLVQEGFTVVMDEYGDADPNIIGGISLRRFAMAVPPNGNIVLRLEEKRPWLAQDAPLTSIEVHLSTFGKEGIGIPRRQRQLEVH